ncbi:MAG TPA: hypothetical protein VMI10_07540 [Terriglobales bacterium]|nr:hypothetical protein [Terriglobales bacterium]
MCGSVALQVIPESKNVNRVLTVARVVNPTPYLGAAITLEQRRVTARSDGMPTIWFKHCNLAPFTFTIIFVVILALV